MEEGAVVVVAAGVVVLVTGVVELIVALGLRPHQMQNSECKYMASPRQPLGRISRTTCGKQAMLALPRFSAHHIRARRLHLLHAHLQGAATANAASPIVASA